MDTIKERLETELKEAEQEKQQLEARLENKPDFSPGEGATLAVSWEMALARKGHLWLLREVWDPD